MDPRQHSYVELFRCCWEQKATKLNGSDGRYEGVTPRRFENCSLRVIGFNSLSFLCFVLFVLSTSKLRLVSTSVTHEVHFGSPGSNIVTSQHKSSTQSGSSISKMATFQYMISTQRVC